MGALEQARDIYLRTAEIYVEQGLPRKAMTVYRSVLKLTPGLPLVRERLADIYRQMGMIADALRELEAAADEHQRAGDLAATLPPLRKIVGLRSRQHRGAHQAGGDRVAARRGRRGGSRAHVSWRDR